MTPFWACFVFNSKIHGITGHGSFKFACLSVYLKIQIIVLNLSLHKSLRINYVVSQCSPSFPSSTNVIYSWLH